MIGALELQKALEDATDAGSAESFEEIARRYEMFGIDFFEARQFMEFREQAYTSKYPTYSSKAAFVFAAIEFLWLGVIVAREASLNDISPEDFIK